MSDYDYISDPHDLSLLDFSRGMFKSRKGIDFVVNWHHKTICETLERVVAGEITRLIINIPPRYSKTELAVINFMAWSLGNHQDAEFIHASYSHRLAALNSWQCRSLVGSEEYQELYPVKLKSDSQARDEWRTEAGGCVYAAGSGGTITGYGAGKVREGFGGAIIIDDPHKADEANSEVMRANVIEWFKNTIESRCNSRHTPIIVIMQRLHECLLPTTPVMTPDGMIGIENIKTGDKVLTSTGYANVIGIAKKEYDNTAIEVELFGYPESIITTHTHLFYSNHGWIEAEKIKAGDWIAYMSNDIRFKSTIPLIPEPRLSAKIKKATGTFNGKRGGSLIDRNVLVDLLSDGKSNTEIAKILGVHRNTIHCAMFQYQLSRVSIKSILDVDGIYDDLMFYRVMGYWLAEGSLLKGRNSHVGLSFVFSYKEEVYVNEIIDFFKNRNINVTIEHPKSTIKIKAWTAQLSDYFLKNFNHGSHNKKLPEWALSLSYEKKVNIIRGWMRGDGCFIKSKGLYRGTSVSHKLIDGFSNLLASIGVPSYITKNDNIKRRNVIDGRHSVSSGMSREVRFYSKDLQLEQNHEKVKLKESNLKIKFNDGFVWKKVKKVRSFKYKGMVHDIETETGDFVSNTALLHNCDLSGWLLNGGNGEKWTHLNIPAIADGKPLWEHKHTLADLERMRKADEYTFAGQYLQTPSPIGGGILKKVWWRIWPEEKALPICDHIFASWDTAYSEGDFKRSSYSAMTLWGVFHDEQEQRYNLILLSAWDGKIDYPDLRAKAQQVTKDKQPDCHLIEKKASGQSLIQDLRRAKIKVRTYNPDRDKISRAYAVSAMLQSGQIWAPERKWAQRVIDMLAVFPNGAPPSSDYTDTCTQAWLYLRNGLWVTHPDDDEESNNSAIHNQDSDEDNEIMIESKSLYA